MKTAKREVAATGGDMMDRNNRHGRPGNFFAALPKWLLPAICILALILACILWFSWPVSLAKAAGVAGEVQHIYMIDFSSPFLSPKEKLITDEGEIGEFLRIRLCRSVLSDNAVRNGWAYSAYLKSGDSGPELIFLTEKFVQIRNRTYILLDKPAFLDLMSRIYR